MDAPAGASPTIALAWDPSADSAVSGYRLYLGTASRNYSVAYDAGDATSFTVAGLQVGTVYFFATTAYDTNGLESDFSTELVYTNGFSTAPSGPQITNLVRTADGNFTVSGVAVPGQICVLLAAANLVPPVRWTPIATNTVDAQATVSLADLQATNYPQRFYRFWQTGPAVIPPSEIAASVH
jgi:hypothetical protein